jgi:uncharacterized protein (DUF2267 family)
MNELVGLIVEKTGVSEESATQAVEVVMGYLREHLPVPVAAQIENYLSGEGTGGAIEGVKELMGRMFGKSER